MLCFTMTFTASMLPVCAMKWCRFIEPDAQLNSIDRLLDYRTRWMYLAHLGETGYPDRNAQSLGSCISESVKLGEQIELDDPETALRLESDLRDISLAKLTGAGLSVDEVSPLLENDISLNAQGIAHWRKASLWANRLQK